MQNIHLSDCLLISISRSKIEDFAENFTTVS
uniref:Uncharacterized protein n=1 Tax=Rhizophora mucronata TaxID=61149 RepID=A0A2P2NI80_RHIMU